MNREMNMLKKLSVIALGLGLVCQAQAFDKTQVNLDQNFWGTWSVYNEKNKCTETYQFAKPGQFTYKAKQKKLTGDFAVLRNPDPTQLDLLHIEVKTDNKKADCSGEIKDYTTGQINLSLKWMSTNTAELCVNREGTSCTGLFLIKQK